MTITLRRRTIAAIAIIVSVLTLVGGSAVGLVGPFVDVDPSNTHAGNIEAIYLAGVSLGCGTVGNQYCPNDAVTRAQMASFLARMGGLSSPTRKNFPRTNAKSDAQTYCQLASDMKGTFDTGPCWATDTFVADATGAHSAVAIGSDELPIIAFYDDNGKDLKVAHCATVDCVSATVTTLDSTGDVGRYPSIMIGDDGYAVISYYDDSLDDLKVAKCDTRRCNAGHHVVVVDNTVGEDVGQYSSIALGPEGSPMISYYEALDANPKFAYCTEKDCSIALLSTIQNDSADTGKFTSLSMGRDGFPVMSYFDEGNGELKVATCSSYTCGDPLDITITTPDADGAGSYTSLVIGGNGNPVISYRDESLDRVKVALCSSPTCAGTTTIRTFGGRAVGDGYWTSIAIDTTGNPVFSHVSGAPNSDLIVTSCLDPTCATALQTGGSNSTIPLLPTSVAIAIDGEPIVVYFDGSVSDVRLHRPRFLVQAEVI